MQLRKIFAPCNSMHTPLLVLRLVIGLAFINYGYGKVTGGTVMWEQIGGSMANIGIQFGKVFWGFMASWTEFGGGILLILGLFVRPVSLLMLFTMIMAATSHLKAGDPLYVASHAIELGAVFILLIYAGGGKYALDQLCYLRFRK